MKETILWAGVGVIVTLLLLQRLVLFKQKTAQLSVPTQDDDGVYLFTSASCAICTQMKNIHAASIEQGRIVVCDVMEQPAWATRYKIMAVPTTIVVRKGSVAQVWHGVVQAVVLSPWL